MGKREAGTEGGMEGERGRERAPKANWYNTSEVSEGLEKCVLPLSARHFFALESSFN